MVLGRKAQVTVTWNLDEVPGWNHDPLDFQLWLQKMLSDSMPHYNPVVTADSDHSEFVNPFGEKEGV